LFMLIEGGAFLYAEDPVAELWHTGDPDEDYGDTYATEIYRTPKAAAKAPKAAKAAKAGKAGKAGKAAPAAAGTRCGWGCGNSKSPDALVCNACLNSGSNSNSNTSNTKSTTPTSSSSSSTGRKHEGTKRKVDEELKSGGVIDLTGDDDED
jgi:hypothetical protein